MRVQQALSKQSPRRTGFNLRIESLVIERTGLCGHARNVIFRFNLRIESLVIEREVAYITVGDPKEVSISELRVLLLRGYE